MAFNRIRLPDGSRSVQSPWVWRGFLLLALVAFGLCLTFATGGLVLLAGAWGFIAAGWGGISLWLWRRHAKYNDELWAAESTKAGKSR